MSTNLSTLRTRTRRYIGETTADRWTDSEVDAYINEGIRSLQSEIETANPEWFLRVETFTASADVYQAAMPSNIFGGRLRELVQYDNSTVASGEPNIVKPAQSEWVYQNLYYSGIPLGYTMFAGYLQWAPMLQYASTFRYVYSKAESTLTGDTDVLDRIIDQHTDAICLYAAILAQSRFGFDVSVWSALYERKLNQMRNDVQPTDTFVVPQQEIDP